jgi:hypothetical protein
VGDDEKSSITINRVTSTNQQGGITANEVHIYEKEKEPELTKENLDLLFQEALNLKLPPNYPTDGNVHIPTILHGETLSEFKMYEKKGWLTIKSNGNLTNMGANNRIGDSIEEKKRPWGMSCRRGVLYQKHKKTTYVILKITIFAPIAILIAL